MKAMRQIYRDFEDSIADTYKKSYLAGKVTKLGIKPTTLHPEAGVYGSSASGGEAGGSRTNGKTNFSEVARKVIHHSAEKIFNKAVVYIFGSNTNAVICDILVREKGVINHPSEVHSVILYKKPPVTK